MLVDRLWPRGVAKDRANLAAWLPGVAPTVADRRAAAELAAQAPGTLEVWLVAVEESHPRSPCPVSPPKSLVEALRAVGRGLPRWWFDAVP